MLNLFRVVLPCVMHDSPKTVNLVMSLAIKLSQPICKIEQSELPCDKFIIWLCKHSHGEIHDSLLHAEEIIPKSINLICEIAE
jgi:hypothetical protein